MKFIMFQRLCRSLKINYIFVRLNSQASEETLSRDITLAHSGEIEEYFPPKFAKSVLEHLEEDISHIAPYLKPTFNFAAYINKSDTLQQLLKLGVNFHKIEHNVEAVQFMLGLTIEDIKEHIEFLNSLGLEMEQIGYLITNNPLLLKEDLENLKIRINYLQYKKFSNDMITHIIEANSFWLTHSTQQIDERLGFIQNQFKLSGNEVRLVTVKCPKLMTFSIDKIKTNTFVLKEEMGFNDQEVKNILLTKPSIFIKGQDRMLKAFEFLHRNMSISLERFVEEPEILTCRPKRLMERHLFLVELGKDQYDPKKPNYVALSSLIAGSDTHFSTEVARSSIQAYNAFLKSL